MERTSYLYLMRRKLQLVAHKLFSDEFMSKVYYRIVMKKKLSFKNPKTFNEKLQWLKLYYYPQNEDVIIATDKYKVRDYVKQKGLEGILTPLIGVWDNVSDIKFSYLPDQFVLKCNHGCAYNIVCDDKISFDINDAKKRLGKWMKEDFGAFNIEIHYSEIKEKKVICEEYLGADLLDYKFFCFNGIPKYLYISEDLLHDRQAKIGYFDTDGNKLNLKRNEYADYNIEKFPTFYEKMLKDAAILSKDFPFVRVDFFVTKEKYYFAELTFTPGGCMNNFNPERYDFEWGQQLDIQKYYFR